MLLRGPVRSHNVDAFRRMPPLLTGRVQIFSYSTVRIAACSGSVK